MILTLCFIVIFAIFIICGILILKVVQVYLFTTKDKKLWEKKIKEETQYQFIKGLY